MPHAVEEAERVASGGVDIARGFRGVGGGAQEREQGAVGGSICKSKVERVDKDKPLKRGILEIRISSTRERFA